MLLGGDHHERAAVELAGGLRAVDELPQPGERGLRVAVVAVVDAQAAAAAVLARLGDVGAQLVDRRAGCRRRRSARSAPRSACTASCRGRRRAARRRRTARRRCRSGRRLVRLWISACPRSRLAPCAWSVSSRSCASRSRLATVTGSAGCLAGARGLLLLGGGRRPWPASSSWVRLIAVLTSSRYSGRSTMIGRPALELDQHAGGARLVDVVVGEADLRRAVGVAVELLVQLLGVARRAARSSCPAAARRSRARSRSAGRRRTPCRRRCGVSAASSTQPGSRVSRSAAQALPSSR